MSQVTPTINQSHTVKVNDGSGVLIQPMTPDYAYVLTARHCLQIDKDTPKGALRTSHTVLSFCGEDIPILYIIVHDTKDIAILIVGSKPTSDLMISCDALVVNEQFRLCGFPQDRVNEPSQYSSFIFKYDENVDEKWILAPTNSGVVASNIVGFSGGGLFTIGEKDSPISLCAIETKMDGNLSREYHGKISAIPISDFEDLIKNPQKQYLGNPLAPLLPLHLSSFEHLLEFSFRLVGGSWDNDNCLSLLQACLREAATDAVEVNLFPHVILSKFKMLLKVKDRPENELHSKGLWISLLELLTISILIDKPETVDMTYVEGILRSRKLVYIESEGTWREYFVNILQSGIENLNQDGIIIIKTLSISDKARYEKSNLERTWRNVDISKVVSNPKRITSINHNRSRIHSVVDLAALHSVCIASKEDDYEELTNIAEFNESKQVELLSLLTEEYSSYLRVKGVVNDK